MHEDFTISFFFFCFERILPFRYWVGSQGLKKKFEYDSSYFMAALHHGLVEN